MPSDTPESEPLDPRIVHAQEVYKNRTKMAIYDKWVLGVFCTLVWRCPPSVMRKLYDEQVGQRHLDIGPGTGYFVRKARFPGPNPEITLLDLSAECLEMSARNLADYRPEVCQANLMNPLPLPEKSFDSAAMNLVFHTIPGGWEGKGIIFEHVAATLKPGGRLFGTTVLAEGVPMNGLTRKMVLEQHRRGNFQNQGDDPEGLRRQLAKYFPQSSVEVVGAVAVFKATAG